MGGLGGHRVFGFIKTYTFLHYNMMFENLLWYKSFKEMKYFGDNEPHGP